MSIRNFKAFLDDWSIFGTQDTHLVPLKKCIEKCTRALLALNSKRYKFTIPDGKLQDIVCKEGLKIDRTRYE